MNMVFFFSVLVAGGDELDVGCFFFSLGRDGESIWLLDLFFFSLLLAVVATVTVWLLVVSSSSDAA
jgi:hypothetical protein